MRYPFYFQLDSFDCGPTCLKMIAAYYGREFNLDYLREHCFITREGVNLAGIKQAGEKMGFETIVGKLELGELLDNCQLPAILHWNQEHFVVLYQVKTKQKGRFWGRAAEPEFVIGDPMHGIITISKEIFTKLWQPPLADFGIGLFLKPSPLFYEQREGQRKANTLPFLLRYLTPFRKQIGVLFLYLFATTLIGMSFPYLTKGLVDKGISAKSYYLVLLFTLSQLILFLSSTVLDIFKSKLLLKVNTRLSMNIVSDFMAKLLKLPIRFFDSRSVGDISQRINDHHRIEMFLTGDALYSIFAVIQIVAYSLILLGYSLSIFGIFVSISILGILWIFLFQKKREHLDYIRFSQNKVMQEKLYELVVGMQDIKLNGSEGFRQQEWEGIQQKAYELNRKSLELQQYRQTGFVFLSYSKNIFISFLAAVAIVEGEMSLGTMLSISFIIGQTNGPLQQLVEFFRSAQDAKLSLDRLQEVHQKDNEEMASASLIEGRRQVNSPVIRNERISLENVSFQYEGPLSRYVLQNICLEIPAGKVTAIVGASGSGKSTLLKLLLGFYPVVHGNIRLGDRQLAELSPSWWRKHCGTVMQDGYIYYDTILRNICMDPDNINEAQLELAARLSHVDEFVKQLPLGFNTRIGSSGIGLSGGQKQRILLARAIYRNPHYLFFDEATSSLDACNEKGIMDHLQQYFNGRTVVLIAHRLSTVKNADKIIVLDQGRIIEEGTHVGLTGQKGKYYELVKDQLELGV